MQFSAQVCHFHTNLLANLPRLSSAKWSTSCCISFTWIFGCKHWRDTIKPVHSFLHIAFYVQCLFLLSLFFSVVTFPLRILLSVVSSGSYLSAIFHDDNIYTCTRISTIVHLCKVHAIPKVNLTCLQHIYTSDRNSLECTQTFLQTYTVLDTLHIINSWY